MPCVGFESMIPASERVKTVHALDRSATVTGIYLWLLSINVQQTQLPIQTPSTVTHTRGIYVNIWSSQRKRIVVSVMNFFLFTRWAKRSSLYKYTPDVVINDNS
jgi:hypothetical protein